MRFCISPKCILVEKFNFVCIVWSILVSGLFLYLSLLYCASSNTGNTALIICELNGWSGAFVTLGMTIGDSSISRSIHFIPISDRCSVIMSFIGLEQTEGLFSMKTVFMARVCLVFDSWPSHTKGNKNGSCFLVCSSALCRQVFQLRL